MRSWPRRALTALVALAALAPIGVSAAAKLDLRTAGRAPLVQAWSRCGGQVRATVTGSSVAVSGIGSACSGTTLAAYVQSGSTTLTAATTVVGSTATLALPSAPATVSNAVVTAASWPLPTTWEQIRTDQPTAACSAGSGTGLCTATVTGITSWGYPSTTDYLLNITVSSSSTTPVSWQVTINLSSPDLPFLAGSLSDNQGGLVKVSATACPVRPRTVTVKGTTSWGNYHLVRAGQTSNLQVYGKLTGTGGLVSC